MEERQNAREERAAQLRATIEETIEQLASELAAGHTNQFKQLLAFWSRFHRYSHANVVLIQSQRPDATRVAGYTTWRRVGRQVKRGAKAIQIWCPIIKVMEDPETGLPFELCVGFTPCPVFAAEDLVDIDTNPLPTLWRPLPDDVGALYRDLAQKVMDAGYQVIEQRLPIGRQGMATPEGEIILAKGLDSRNRILCLMHELAHAVEHFRQERKEASRELKELEAESASVVVCDLLGLEHPTARDYILSFSGDAEALKASLGAIHRIVEKMVALLALSQPKQIQGQAAPLAAD